MNLEINVDDIDHNFLFDYKDIIRKVFLHGEHVISPVISPVMLSENREAPLTKDICYKRVYGYLVIIFESVESRCDHGCSLVRLKDRWDCYNKPLINEALHEMKASGEIDELIGYLYL